MEKVIFDTNAYRYLVTDKNFDEIDQLIEKIKNKEQQRGLESLISPIVAKELLAHVADKKDPSFQKCLNAIKAMYLHNGDGESYRLIASPEMLIAKSFFNEAIPAKEETNKAMIQIAYHLAKKPSAYVFRKFQRNLNLNRDHVLDSENNYALTLRQFVKTVDPSATGWKIFPDNPQKRQETLANIRSINTSLDIAAGYISIVYQLLLASGKQVHISDDDLYDMSQEFIKVFPEVVAHYKFVLENLVNSEFNLLENNRNNFVWDTQLMFNIGNHSISGEKLYFVTADKAIISTAIGQNAKYTILTYEEYLDYIN
jgi:hypothetical protein